MRTPVLILAAVFFLAGCGGLTGRISPEPAGTAEALALIRSLKERNAGLSTFKGLGRILLLDGEPVRTIRTAWVGSGADMLRFEFLGPAGRPEASLASDGRFLYFDPHDRAHFYKKRLSQASLKDFISVDLTSSEIVSLLAGRIPLAPHDRVRLERNSGTGERVIILEKRWWGLQQKIYLDGSGLDGSGLDGSGTEVTAIELFDGAGELSYRATLGEMQTVEGYRVPMRLSFSDGQGEKALLRIEKYWANVPVDPLVFELRPPVL